MSRTERLLIAAVSIGGAVLLVTAASLDPDPRGHGTHEQLGLFPCWIHATFGITCPTCGGTTAWAHMMHGELTAALTTNLAAALLCIAALLAVPWALACAIGGKWLLWRPQVMTLLVIAAVWLLFAVLTWTVREWVM